MALICVKLYATAPAVRQWKPALARCRAIVSLQNGLDGVDRIATEWGGKVEPPLLRGLAFMSGTMLSAGHLRYTSNMSAIQFGGANGREAALLTQFTEACSDAGFTATSVEDIVSAQWAKFVALATNAAMTCLTRRPAGVCYHDEVLLELAKRSIAEVVAVGRAAGAKLPDAIERDSLALLQSFPPHMYASMYHDLQGGKPLELDGLSGHVVRSGTGLWHRHPVSSNSLGMSSTLCGWKGIGMNLTDPPFGYPSPPGMAQAEWSARQDLALAYRLFDQFGWHELIYNHITVRVPDEEGRFLINPFGLMYREITASNLVKIDVEGRVLSNAVEPHQPCWIRGSCGCALASRGRSRGHSFAHDRWAGRFMSAARIAAVVLFVCLFPRAHCVPRLRRHHARSRRMRPARAGPRIIERDDSQEPRPAHLRSDPGARVQSALPVAACMRGTDRGASRRCRHQTGAGGHRISRCRAVCGGPDQRWRRRDAL